MVAASSASWAAYGRSPDRRSRRAASPTAWRGRAAIAATTSPARASSVSAGHTSVTSPQSSAVAASMGVPVSRKSAARRAPTAAGSSALTPQSGDSPTEG